MSKFILIRLISFILVITGALFCPWWMMAILAILGMILFNNFYEAVFSGFLFDLIYGSAETKFYFTLAALAALYLIAKIKRFIYVHSSFA